MRPCIVFELFSCSFFPFALCLFPSMSPRPNPSSLINQNPSIVPMSLQRILKESSPVDSLWVGPKEAAKLTKEEKEAYEAAHTIIRHLAIEMPRAHSSGHPGGPLSRSEERRV